MDFSRRQLLLSTLFGAGAIGLRALATGLPAAFLLKPRKALADLPTMCANKDKAQYIIFATSGSGDPINANVPGTYTDTNIAHSLDPMMAPTRLTLAGKQYTAAAPWATLPQAVLDRTCFWHLMTNTPVHPKEPDVLKLMGTTTPTEMFPSLLAKYLAPCLGTIQVQPVSVGATSPSEGLSYAGAALPIIPPPALKATLTNPAGPLGNLQALRDQTLNQLYDLYKNGASPAQKAYIDSLVSSQQQVRGISQNLLDMLSGIKDSSVGAQTTAALALIQMNVTPVVAIHIPFGGDNHSDAQLKNETTQHLSGIAAIGTLMSDLATAGLTDKVTLVTLNVFGRTIGPVNTDGRQHNPNHQVSVTIGKPLKGGVIGGVAPVSNDYGATSINSMTGAGGSGGDIAAIDTLASFAKTVMTSVGVDSNSVSSAIHGGTVISAALA